MSAARGRLAPTPTGSLHLGHAATFLFAAQLAKGCGGTLVFRLEDLDPQRCRPEFARAALEDLAWLGLTWDAGPDIGGPHSPYQQSERRSHYQQAWQRLWRTGHIYPSTASRKEWQALAQAPHAEEPLFPVELRQATPDFDLNISPGSTHWRFRVPDGEVVAFVDQLYGPQAFVAGQDFGDFLIWSHDDIPAYELAVVVDDHAMGITQVVRGRDLLLSTARQQLLAKALGATLPQTCHAPLLMDDNGQRLAKRHHSLSLAAMRESGLTPSEVRHLALQKQEEAAQREGLQNDYRLLSLAG
ncbi:MAG: glutamate--tRNA ligase family protein [Verrucomicrobiales bacterium]